MLKRNLLLSVGFALLLSACGLIPIPIAMDDFELTIADTGGGVCYLKLAIDDPPITPTRVTYKANVTLQAGVGNSSAVTMNLYGRAEAPQGIVNDTEFCVEVPNEFDLSLLPGVQLEDGVAQQINITDSNLRSLLANPPLWIGASVSSDGVAGGSVLFTDGVVTVYP